MEPRQPHQTVVTATASDLAYVEHLARLHSNSIGFVPRAALLDHIERSNVRLLMLNGQHAGYTLAGGGKVRPYRLIQVAISEELWRNGYGAVLIYDARRTAAERPMSTMTASIRDGLPMLDVAEHTGARRTATILRNTARHKPVHDYLWPRLSIPENIARDLSPRDLLYPGKIARSAQQPPGAPETGGETPQTPLDKVEEL